MVTALLRFPRVFAAATVAAAALAPLSAKAQDGFLSKWQARATATQNAQPHWVTPLVTVTPRLEQELRTDFVSQPQTANHTRLWGYDNGKGLELIPTRHIELLANLPPYLEHNNPSKAEAAKDGFGDVSFLMKYRLYGSNEEQHNAIITAFVGGSLTTGTYLNGARNATVSPTLAVGKGVGGFDVQSTIGAALPVDQGSTLGRPIAWNTALQYHKDPHWWPEVEFNSTFFKGGPNDGRIQNFVTPGVLSRWRLHNRLGVTLGAGIQLATTHYHGYDHGVVFSGRMPF